jgi:hypothetical protein
MYMRVEVGFPGCEKAIKAGGEALWMWLAMKAYCKVNETDGRVPACMIGRLQGPEPTRQKRLVARLVEARLVDVSGRDFMLHDYLDWEESSADAAKRRANARKRKADWEQRHAAREERDRNGVPNTVTTDHGNAVPNASVTVGGTDHREGKGREGKGNDPPVAPQGGAEYESDPWGITPPEQPDQSRAKPEPIATVARRIFEAWKLDTGHAKAVLDAKRQRRIEARLREGFTEQDLLDALEGRHSDPWLMGTDPKSPRLFDEIDTLYRDAAQVEKLRDLRRGVVTVAGRPPRRADGLDDIEVGL